MARIARAARRLLQDLFDYAGMYPPAGLPLTEAAKNYERYRQGQERWMLGRLVVPAERVRELAEKARGGWRISALLVTDAQRELGQARALGAEAVEYRRGLLAKPPDGFQAVFIEMPMDEWEPVADAAIKIRTGGLTPESFPSVEQLADFLRRCAAAGQRFKVTAGLHHAIRGSYPLTYETGSGTATMHGFLNLLIAMGAAVCGGPVEEILADEDKASFRFDEEGAGWRDYRFTEGQLERARGLLLKIGSCSFDEPVEELRSLGLI